MRFLISLRSNNGMMRFRLLRGIHATSPATHHPHPHMDRPPLQGAYVLKEQAEDPLQTRDGSAELAELLVAVFRSLPVERQRDVKRRLTIS